jgi:hypothetical protein
MIFCIYHSYLVADLKQRQCLERVIQFAPLGDECSVSIWPEAGFVVRAKKMPEFALVLPGKLIDN